MIEKVVRAPKSRLLHKGAATMKHGEFAIYHTYKNKLRFILKNYGIFTKFTAGTTNTIYLTIRSILYALKGDFKLSKAIIKGIFWNMKNWKDYI